MREQFCLFFACPFLIQVEIVSQVSPQFRGRSLIDLLVTVHRKQGDELPLEKQLRLPAPSWRGVARAEENSLPNVIVKGAGEKDQ